MADSNLKSRVVENAAKRLGLPTKRLDYYTVSVTIAGVGHVFLQMCGPTASAAQKYVCDNKDVTRALLREAGIPLNEGAVFRYGEAGAAEDFAEALGYPVVVKPTHLSKGRGVTVGVQDEVQLRDAIEHARGFDDRPEGRFLVERQFVGGEDYRFIVVDGRVVAVTRRVPAFVVGNGVKSVAQLIEDKNVARAANEFFAERLIPLDLGRLPRLEREGGALDDVPSTGQYVQLQDIANSAVGGEHVEITDEVHPRYLDVAIQSIAAVPGMNYGGLDFFIRDALREPRPDQDDMAISEVEFSPAPAAAFVMSGTPRDAGRAILEFYLRRAGLPAG
jgi:D-alanine-D-alanine ligase-like ATP-grasp enzyme